MGITRKLSGLKKGLTRTINTRRERMKYGYGDTDLWNFDKYLAAMLADALPRIPGFYGEDKTKLNFIVDQMEKYKKAPYTFSNYTDKDIEDFHRAFKYLGEIFMGMWY